MNAAAAATYDAALARRKDIWKDTSVDEAKPQKRARPSMAVPIRPEDLYVLVTHSGTPIKRSRLDSAWRRLMHAAIAAGVPAEGERFTPHGLRHRGITDTHGTHHEKQRSSGHKSERMIDTYD